jgi:hypothetical protein
MSSLVDLAVEHWRLKTFSTMDSAPARHAVRRIGDFLALLEIQTESMDGKPFDPGLPVRVVDTVVDETLSEGKTVIAETVSPAVLFRDSVIRPADVVTHTGRIPEN